jgi:hypothetical protein
MVPFQPGDSRAFWELARFAKKELSPSQTFQSLSTSLHGLEAIMFKDMDVETAAQIAAVAFARDLMVSNLGQMPYESEFGKLKLEAVWGPTALQGLEGCCCKVQMSVSLQSRNVRSRRAVGMW